MHDKDPNFYPIKILWQTLYSLVAQTVKNLLVIQETWIQFLGREDPLEKGMATHSIILAWRIPWIEEPGRLQSIFQRVRHNWVTNTFTFFFSYLVSNCLWFWLLLFIPESFFNATSHGFSIFFKLVIVYGWLNKVSPLAVLFEKDNINVYINSDILSYIGKYFALEFWNYYLLFILYSSACSMKS